VLYIAAMWIAGVMQGLMWRAVNPDGTLVYSFVESVKATFPFYVIRWLGGLLYLSGMLIMAWNVFMTVKGGKAAEPIPGRGRARLSPQGEHNMANHAPSGHEKIETSNFLMIVLILLARASAAGRDRAAVLPALDHAAGRRASSPTPRCSWPGATSTSARAATTATRR
jgi:hypothetical protein